MIILNNRENRMKRSSIWGAVLLVLVLGWTSTIAAQQSIGIVSPNTKTDLKLEQAIAGMKSEEESRLVNQAVNLSCVVRSRITAFRALGSWSDGAEPSVLLRVKGDEATLRYLLSRMGRDAEQKYVIYFHPKPKGEADLYTLTPRAGMRNLVALTNELERAGIPFRTLVPSGRTTAIYVIDLERDLRTKIMTAARRLRAQVKQESGKAQLFGDDAREKAKIKFEEEIRTYEEKNPKLPPTCDVQKKMKRR
jgi:hypothetical protein